MSVAADAVTKVVNAEAVNPSNLQARNNAADYIVIAPSELASAAKPLADYRTSQGLKTMVINVDDIMNEFNFGLSSPDAIRKFLSYAYSNWKKAPQYVVLAGEGTWDYRNNLGFGWNLVPPALVPSLYGLATSDNSLADINGDHLPEMAIGRLPALTPRELQNAITNIKNFEKTKGNRIILLADNPDDAGDFTAESEGLAALFPYNYIREKVYLSEVSANTARTMLFNDLGLGAAFFNYIGHASPYQLSGQGVLTTDDMSLLPNTAGLPIMTAMTCSAGEFAIPGYSTLGSLLVLKGNGGAAAVWSSTGLSDDSEAKILNREFYKAIFTDKKKTLGDAVKQALAKYKLTGSLPFMTDIYGILGDPALKIRLR
jgi:Peptidase family C25